MTSGWGETIREGVWVVYYFDYAAIISSVHSSELEARREAGSEYSYVTFLPWGMKLTDALMKRKKDDGIQG